MKVYAKKMLLIALMAVSFSPLSVFPSDWPTFMANEYRTGYVSRSALPPFNFLWSYDIPGNIVSSPVLYKNILYFTSRNGYIYALNAASGEYIWDFSTDGFVDAAVSVSSNSLIVPSLDGKLYSLNRLTGEPLWTVSLGAPSVSSPLIKNGRIYVGVGEPVNALKAFDLATGAELFSVNVSQPVRSAPAFCQGRIVFASNDGKVYAVSPEAGDVLFSYPFTGGAFEMNSAACSGDIFSLPGHDERKIYKNSSSDGSVLSYSTDLTENPGTSEWNWQRVSSPLISTSAVYVSAGSDNAYLIGLDKNDVSSVVMSSVAVGGIGELGWLPFMSMAGNLIFSGTADSGLSVISSTGAVVFRISLSSAPVFSAPAIADGRIFFCDYGGRVYAYSADRYADFDNLSDGDIINSSYTVAVNAMNPGADGWKLEYAADDGNENFILLSSSSYSGEKLSSFPVFNWNTALLANGQYLLRFSFLNDTSSLFPVYAIAAFRINQKPAPPSSLSASDNPNDNGNKIRLNWQASVSNISGYRIYRSQGSSYYFLASVSSSSLSYLDTSAVTGSTFSYRLTSWDGWLESDPSAAASAFSVNDNPLNDSAAPSAVIDLSCLSGSYGGSVSLHFTAPGDDGNIGRASHYLIKYATFSFPWDSGLVWKSSKPVGGAYGFAESENVNDIFGGVTYYFKLKAYDTALNESPVSNESYCTAAIDTVAPAGISSFSVADTPGDKGGRLTLTWSLSADDGGGANDVYGYKIYRSTRSGVYDYSSPYAIVAKGLSGWLDNSAAVNVKYFYRAAAFDSTNNSPLSEEKWGISADNWRYVDFRNGGLMLSDDGAEILIPPNSLNQNDSMIMVKLNPSTLQPLSASRINTAAAPTGIYYEVKFETPGTRLLSYAEIKIPYSPSDISGMQEENLRIYQKVADSWRLLDSSRVLASDKKVYARINSLGIYSLMEYRPSGALISSENIYTYPNPAKGDRLVFKFLPSEKSDIAIDVYNVAGEKVASLSKNNCPAGISSEIEWNIRNIASGVYIYSMEAVSASGKKTLKKKLAIEH